MAICTFLIIRQRSAPHMSVNDAQALSGPLHRLQGKYHSILDEQEIRNFERTLRILLDETSATEFRENVGDRPHVLILLQIAHGLLETPYKTHHYPHD